MGRDLWYLLVKGAVGKSNYAFADMYVFEDHLGAAVHKAITYAKVAGMKDCQPVEAYPISRLGYQLEPEDTERIAEDVFIGKGLHTFQANESESLFTLPKGILRSAIDGILEPEADEEHVAVHGPDEAGFFTLVVVFSDKSLKQIFFHLANHLREIDKLFLTVKDYNGSGKVVRHWVNSALSGKESILRFIRENLSDTLENGFVELSLYVLEGETCICLGDDKLLTLTTRDEMLFKFLHAAMSYFGVKEGDRKCMPRHEHWRYRPYNSLDMVAFQELLSTRGFKAVEEVEHNVEHTAC